MKSIGDLRLAPTMRDIPFEAPMAFSRVILLGLNSFFCPIGDEDRDPGFLSLERDRDRDKVPRRASFNDDPREVKGVISGAVVEAELSDIVDCLLFS